MSSFVDFVKESYIEFKDRVEWPKWTDLQSSTLVVSVATVILAIFLFGVDTLFSKFIENALVMLINLFN
ncbi:preprotein translocase subunit SecE [Bergeyella porcorum]|uniref:Protein translocase subunit SecE n=1 Tax=Bergeyella porcorum TaxID=1735111 RepID=A0AAU0F0T8_9FLAO